MHKQKCKGWLLNWVQSALTGSKYVNFLHPLFAWGAVQKSSVRRVKQKGQPNDKTLSKKLLLETTPERNLSLSSNRCSKCSAALFFSVQCSFSVSCPPAMCFIHEDKKKKKKPSTHCAPQIRHFHNKLWSISSWQDNCINRAGKCSWLAAGLKIVYMNHSWGGSFECFEIQIHYFSCVEQFTKSPVGKLGALLIDYWLPIEKVAAVYQNITL